MNNDRTCSGYPICPACGEAMMFTEPIIRVGDYVIHLDCRGRFQPPVPN